MKIVTFGEIMMRLNPEGYQRFVQAEKFEASYAGGEANVAVSLANYGGACGALGDRALPISGGAAGIRALPVSAFLSSLNQCSLVTAKSYTPISRPYGVCQQRRRGAHAREKNGPPLRCGFHLLSPFMPILYQKRRHSGQGIY